MPAMGASRPSASNVQEMAMQRYLTAEDVIDIHNRLVVVFADDGDPISPHGVRDTNLIEMAVHRPQTSRPAGLTSGMLPPPANCPALSDTMPPPVMLTCRPSVTRFASVMQI